MTQVKATYAFGAVMYFLGFAAVNSVLSPLRFSGNFHPALELSVIALGVFFLSALYYGRFYYLPLLACGLYFGGLFAGQPFYSVFALAPLLYAMASGAQMGQLAYEDFRGKTNLFEKGTHFAANAVWAIVISVIIGLLLGGLGFEDLPSIGLDLSALEDFISSLTIQ
ncbi:MAG TPA: hypothetical protein VJH23_00105 [archaeon]|nr:hypothetical protein [archaeon]